MAAISSYPSMSNNRQNYLYVVHRGIVSQQPARAHCKHKSFPRCNTSPYIQVQAPQIAKVESRNSNSDHSVAGHLSQGPSSPAHLWWTSAFNSLLWPCWADPGSYRKYDLMTLQSHCTLPHLQLVFLCYIPWVYNSSEKNLLSLTGKSDHPICSFCLHNTSFMF